MIYGWSELLVNILQKQTVHAHSELLMKTLFLILILGPLLDQADVAWTTQRWGCMVRGQTCHSLLSMRKAKALLRLREREQISLIDGYKMLRMELEAQQARALEWNGVHS